MENKAHALVAGLFVVLLSALLVAMAVWLMRDTAAQREFLISSREAVTGLQSQAPVRFRGVAVGKVTDIGFDPATRGNILVRIAVDDQAPITQSTFATLGLQGVTGLAFVQLDDTGESQQALTTSATEPTRIPMRSSLLSKISDQGVSILARLEQTSERVNDLLSPQNQQQIMATVQGIGETAASLRELSERVNKLATNVDGLLATQLGPTRVSIPQFVQEATTTLQGLQKTAGGIDQTAADFRVTAAATTKLIERLNAPDGVVDRLAEGAAAMAAAGNAISAGTLPRLNRTTEDAARTARQVSRTVNAVSDNPQSLIFGHGAARPGPGEPGFQTPKGAQ